MAVACGVVRGTAFGSTEISSHSPVLEKTVDSLGGPNLQLHFLLQVCVCVCMFEGSVSLIHRCFATPHVLDETLRDGSAWVII